jgi:hypothetical protein
MGPRMTAAAAARLVRRKGACPECAGSYGCRAARRGCAICSPPRNSLSRPKLDEDDP